MSIRLEPLGAGNRVDGVFEQLRSRILAGDFPSGERLPNERELAEALGVNRASLREALKRLEFLELVEVRHGQGTFVREPSASSSLQLVETLLRDAATVTPELLRQLLEFRRDVTLRVVELAALNHTGDQLERARLLLERERGAAGDPAQALTLDLELNRLLGEATGNLLYQLVSNLFTKLVQRLGPLYYNEGRDHRRSHVIHERLLDAIAARNAAGARGIVGEMLRYSEQAITAEVQRLDAAGVIGPGSRESAA
jgi:GntR family transcriptional repressor for pyruvate dehydrogenase complex